VLSGGAPQHAWLRLPAGTSLRQIVRTIVNLGNGSPGQRKSPLNTKVYFQEIFQANLPGSHASLVRHHKDFVASAIQRSHRLHRAGDKFHLTPGSYIVPVRRFVIDDPVSVEKDCPTAQGIHIR
jgi:hypothetical protein